MARTIPTGLTLLSAIVSLVLLDAHSAGAQDIGYDVGLTYYKGSDYTLKVDVAYPRHPNGLRPALAYFHGGSWAGGERNQFATAILEAAHRGFVAATFDYRLTSPAPPNNRFPVQLYDAKSAIRWLRANAGKYSIDPSRIGAVGWSSGGQLALMLGLTRKGDGLEGDEGYLRYSSSVQAVVSLAGISDLIDEFQRVAPEKPYLVHLLGGTPAQLRKDYRTASPVDYLRKGGPPVLSICGSDDEWVPCRQSVSLDSRLAQFGIPHELIVKNGGTHITALQSVYDQAVWSFLEKYLERK